MASGVGVSDECINKFQELKLGKKIRYLTFKLNDSSSEIVLEREEPIATTYDQFVEALPKDDCRYIVYDFEYELPNEGTRNKILFIVWAPDTARIKSKMLYTSSKADFRKRLVGVGVEVQATDLSEIDREEILAKVLR